MSVTVAKIGVMARGQAAPIDIDWGENTAGQGTGILKGGNTVASCTVSVDDKPLTDPVTTDPTLSAVSVNTTDLWVGDEPQRKCSPGEATTCLVTMGASQTYGIYRFLFTATTSDNQVWPIAVKIQVMERR